MPFELNDNSGMLFKNDRPRDQNSAQYNGSIKVNGSEFWLNAWVKDGKRGKYFSLSVKPKPPMDTQPQQPTQQYQPQQPTQQQSYSPDLPF